VIAGTASPGAIAALVGYPELKDIAEDAASEARGGNPHILITGYRWTAGAGLRQIDKTH
jgi:hypothetical protein